VDLDGTLIKTDVLWESVMLLARHSLWQLLKLPIWLLRGRAFLKRQIALRVALDVEMLPFSANFLQYLRAQHATGRRLVLVTASDRIVAEAIGQHVALFDEVIASEGTVNVSGAGKRNVLVGKFGMHGYDYAGNSRADLPVWRACHRAILVNAGRGLRSKAAACATVEQVFHDRKGKPATWLRAARIHQWAKNVLVFLPLITSHTISSSQKLLQSVLAFIVFSLCASSVYILNDLFDISSDRQHAIKRRRAFAAGDASIPSGLLAALVFLLGAATLSLLLPWRLQAVMVGYLTVATAYSLWFKHYLLVDVFVLGGLYAVRVLAGGAATGIWLSPWLIAFCMFFFLSLALVKRFAELIGARRDKLAGRDYAAEDLHAIGSLGTSSGFMCVLVLALYINSPQVTELYRSPEILWLLCPLVMYWISRMWIIAHRGKMDSDPLVFAVRDRISYLIAACSALLLLIASKV
jgi:4-hydroxybenzoate polyprenyltransferase/phosphoserine phosphatase